MSNNTIYREKITNKLQYCIRKYNYFNSNRYCQHFLLGIQQAYDNYEDIKNINIPLINEYKSININHSNNLKFKIENKYSTCKLLINDFFEILIYKNEIWINKKKYIRENLENIYIFTFQSNGLITNIDLNNVFKLETKIILFNNIKTNNYIDFIDL